MTIATSIAALEEILMRSMDKLIADEGLDQSVACAVASGVYRRYLERDFATASVVLSRAEARLVELTAQQADEETDSDTGSEG